MMCGHGAAAGGDGRAGRALDGAGRRAGARRGEAGCDAVGVRAAAEVLHASTGGSRAGRSELPDEVVEFVARQVKVLAADLGFYEWSGSTIEYHRAQIREHLGFRVCSVADAEKLTDWLAANVAHAERSPDRVREELVRSAAARSGSSRPRRTGSPGSCARRCTTRRRRGSPSIAARFGAAGTASASWPWSPPARATIEAGTTRRRSEDERGRPDSVLALVKSVPGNVSLESMLAEIRKLTGDPRGRPAGRGCSPTSRRRWCPGGGTRAAVESPSHLRRRCELAAVGGDPAGGAAGRAGAGGDRQPGRPADRHGAPDRRAGRAEGHRGADQRVPAGDRQGEHPVRDRRGLAGPAVGRGAGGGVPGGARRGGDAAGAGARVQDQGAGVPAHRADHAEGLLHQPLPAGPDRAAGRAGVPVDQHRPPAGHRGPGADRPVRAGGEPDLLPGRGDRPGAPGHDRATGRTWCTGPTSEAAAGWSAWCTRSRTFQALREQLRCKEIWVVGAGRWRDPDEDLPKDFEERRAEHYASLRKPLDPAEFIAAPAGGDDRRAGRAGRRAAATWTGWRSPSGAAGAIKLTPLEAAPEPRNLRRIKNEVRAPVDGGPADRRAEGDRAAHRLPAGGHLGRRERAPGRPRCSPSGSCSAIYAYGTNYRDPVGRLGRARPQRGRDPLRPPPLPDPGGRPDSRHRDRRRHLRRPRPRPVGRGSHRGGIGLHALPVLGPEPVHRVALPLRRPRHPGLLARRARVGGRPLPDAAGLGVGGRTRWSRARSGTAPR